MPKDMKTEDAARINVDDMTKVDGGFEHTGDDPGLRACPKCGTICHHITMTTTYGSVHAEYHCQQCGCVFETWNNNPDEYKIILEGH